MMLVVGHNAVCFVCGTQTEFDFTLYSTAYRWRSALHACMHVFLMLGSKRVSQFAGLLHVKKSHKPSVPFATAAGEDRHNWTRRLLHSCCVHLAGCTSLNISCSGCL